jgi:hypothetical protein
VSTASHHHGGLLRALLCLQHYTDTDSMVFAEGEAVINGEFVRVDAANGAFAATE